MSDDHNRAMRCMRSKDAAEHQKSTYTERYAEDYDDDSDYDGLPGDCAVHFVLLSAARLFYFLMIL